MTRWLVDGMNVVGSRPNGWWHDRPGAMRALVEDLADFAREAGEPVTVVFDGRPFPYEDRDGVTVEFATRRGRNAADDDIARLVEGDPEPGELTVVTSDGNLRERARTAGAALMGAGEFRDRLES